MAAVLAVGATACGKAGPSQRDYAQVLEECRPEGGKTVEIVTSPEEDSFGMLDQYGLDPEQMERYAVSISPMNVMAYGVMIVLPAQGKEDAMKKSMQGFIEKQTATFEYYLPEQYEIAQQALLETMPGGELVLVMCQDPGPVMDQIKTALKS